MVKMTIFGFLLLQARNRASKIALWLSTSKALAAMAPSKFWYLGEALSTGFMDGTHPLVKKLLTHPQFHFYIPPGYLT
jgi:hypothetical protein